MPKSIKKKIFKHSNPEMEFKGIMSKFKQSAEKRKNLFIGLSAAVIVLITVTAGFFIYDYSMKKKAAALTEEAYKVYYSPANTPEERYSKAAELFKKTYDTRKSAVSIFYLANCYYETGKLDEALNLFKELVKKDEKLFASLAYYKTSMIHLKKGNSAEALNYLDMLYNLKSGSFKDISLLESARVLEALGKSEESLKKYEQLVKEFPNSPFLNEALSKTVSKKG